MYKQFAVSVIVFKEFFKNTQFLMIHHKKFDKWMIPGGHIEAIENPNEAAIREVFEETGIRIKLISFLHSKLPSADSDWLMPPEYLYQQYIPTTQKEESHYHIDLAYIGLAQNNQLILNHKETNAVEWKSYTEINSINTFEGTRNIITDAYNKLPFKQNPI